MGGLALLASMVATVPAGFAVRLLGVKPPGPVAGTIWSGTAALPNGDRLAWRADPLASSMAMSLVADIAIDGPQAALTGRLSLQAARARLSLTEGRAGWSLLQTALPDLMLDCDIGFRLEPVEIRVVGRAVAIAGSATTDAGACRNPDALKAFSVPATRVAAEVRDGATFASVTLASDPTVTLVQAATTRVGDISITLLPAALDLAEGPPATGPVVYEVRMP